MLITLEYHYSYYIISTKNSNYSNLTIALMQISTNN